MCTSALWGQHPVPSHSESPQWAAPGGGRVPAVTHCLMVCILFPAWASLGLTTGAAVTWWCNGCNILHLLMWQPVVFHGHLLNPFNAIFLWQVSHWKLMSQYLDYAGRKVMYLSGNGGGRGVAWRHVNHLFTTDCSRISPKKQWPGVPKAKESAVRRGPHWLSIWQRGGQDRDKRYRSVNIRAKDGKVGKCRAKGKGQGKRQCAFLILALLFIVNFLQHSRSDDKRLRKLTQRWGRWIAGPPGLPAPGDKRRWGWLFYLRGKHSTVMTPHQPESATKLH